MLDSFKKAKSISSWITFIIALVVYYFSVERTGSLWDVGEFILGAYKLEVVHPPGAPLFMIIGRIFAWFGSVISSDPSTIAFAVNMMSGICTAFGAFFIARITMLLGRHIVYGRDQITTSSQNLSLLLSGIVAGLSTAFCSSIWFSAVEGEVYAMSTFFTIFTLWTAMKWFTLPESPKTDRWLVLTAYSAGLSIGVHLLSLLTLPAVGMLYYIKKYKQHTILGYLLSFAAGVVMVGIVQKVIIVGIPSLWAALELPLVNSFGLPFHSGLVLTLLILGAIMTFLIRLTHTKGWPRVQLFVVSILMVMIGFSTIGVIVIRANADTPINMNVPSDAMRLLPYLNREQYGERPLLYGPRFDARPQELTRKDRYGIVGDKYEVVDQKLDYVFRNKDKIFFPRIGHTEGSKPDLHREWYKHVTGKELKGRPGFGYNMSYLFQYQMGWMYWRYFFWNFVGRQNAAQGFTPWDVRNGHWASGIKPIDEARLHEMDSMTDSMKNHKGSNKYYFIPLILGLIGFFFHAFRDRKTFLAIFALFLITGLGLIIYSNQPPNEPRERDYVLVGSFFTFCIWIGLSVLAIADLLKSKLKLEGNVAVGLAGVIGLIVPALFGFQNYDDHSRMGHYGSRDYASNFLNSVAPNSIIFTYGDNDTYPLWYAQEVENIRRDVRVVNLSLIAVDWYIEKLRRAVNESPPLKLTIPSEEYRGNKRNQVFIHNPVNGDTQTPVDIYQELAFIGNPKNFIEGQTIMRSHNLSIPISKSNMLSKNVVPQSDADKIVPSIDIRLNKNKGYITKDELAVMDLIASNINDRPIYFAVTCNNAKLLGINDYLQMEGLGLRIIPVRSPSIRELSIYGSGRVDTEKTYENVMTKWKWGNFDKLETFIDDSYAAELQAMKIVMLRTSEELVAEGKIDKATNLSKQYFKSFPHFNFPYDHSMLGFIDIINKGGDKEEAKKHLEILGEETIQKMEFYYSLDDEDLVSFGSDFAYTRASIPEIISTAKDVGDQTILQKLEQGLMPYYEKIRD